MSEQSERSNRLRMEMMVQVAFEEITNAGPEGIAVPALRQVMYDLKLIKPEESFDWTSMAVHHLRKELGNDIIVTDRSQRYENEPARYRLVLDLVDAEQNRRTWLSQAKRKVQMGITQGQAQRVRFKDYPGFDDGVMADIEHIMGSVLIILENAAKYNADTNYNSEVRRRLAPVKAVMPVLGSAA